MRRSNILDKPLILERRGNARDSINEARAQFLSFIPDFRPLVITDLYASAFVAYLSAVAERFKDDLPGRDSQSNSSALMRLTGWAIEGMEVENEASVLKDLSKAVKDSLVPARLGLMDLHLHGSPLPPMCVELVGLPLMRTIARLQQIGDSPIHKAFLDWAKLPKSKDSGRLRRNIQQWSIRWNLNAGWCRDHALHCLRQWLFDEPLRWTFLDSDPDFPVGNPVRNSRLVENWNASVRDKRFDVLWSQASLSEKVYDGDPERFVFDWQGIHIESLGLNLLRETIAEWKARVVLDLRMQTYQLEQRRLQKLKASGEAYDENDLDNKLSGALNAFDIKVAEHIGKVSKKVETAKRKHKLVKVKEKRSSASHFAWAVRFQIPKASSIDGESLIAIADSAGLGPPAVSKAVTGILAQVCLTKRSRLRRGRITGSKNQNHVETQILRNLGR